MQNVIGDLRKNIREKKSELYQSDAKIADYERQLQTCEDIKKELRSKTHKETLNRLYGLTSIFNQMTEKSKISMYLAKAGPSSGTKDDLNEDIRNKVEQLKEIQASAPLERYEEIMSELKSKEHLVEASKETEVSISMAQKRELDLEEKIES